MEVELGEVDEIGLDTVVIGSRIFECTGWGGGHKKILGAMHTALDFIQRTLRKTWLLTGLERLQELLNPFTGICFKILALAPVSTEPALLNS